MTAYYNEIDPFAARWLRNLIGAGLIAPGEVDERSISDIRPSDLVGYTQCHFFAGIGGWSLALRLAGWPDSRPVWTGSCPCQPFSDAGQGRGTTDERHLWPHWFHLVRVVRPGIIFGEQVEAAIRYGWLDLVQDDLEGEGYAFAAVGVPAAGVGAPHIRQRLWFVADHQNPRLEGHGLHLGGQPQVTERGLVGKLALPYGEQRDGSRDNGKAGGTELTNPSWMDIPDSTGPQPGCITSATAGHGYPTYATSWDDCEWVYCRDEKWRPVEPGTFPLADGVLNRVGLLRGYGNAIVPQVAAEVIKAYMECRPC